MNIKRLIGVTLLVCCLYAFDAIAANAKQGIDIFVLRSATTADKLVTLGDIAVVQGDDALALKARKVGLGTISLPGQKINIKQDLIKTRLVTEGFVDADFNVMGAVSTEVSSPEKVISSLDITTLAEGFLKEQMEKMGVCEYQIVGNPRQIVLGGVAEEVTLLPKWKSMSNRSTSQIEIGVYAGKKQIGKRDVTFKLKYNAKRALAISDINAGEVIGPENVKIEMVKDSQPTPEDWDNPYGLVAKRRIVEGSEIRPGMAGKSKPEMIVKRNQMVQIRLETSALIVTVPGLVLDNGYLGDTIKVKYANGNSKTGRIIFAQVQEDGTVSPVF